MQQVRYGGYSGGDCGGIWGEVAGSSSAIVFF